MYTSDFIKYLHIVFSKGCSLHQSFFFLLLSGLMVFYDENDIINIKNIDNLQLFHKLLRKILTALISICWNVAISFIFPMLCDIRIRKLFFVQSIEYNDDKWWTLVKWIHWNRNTPKFKFTNEHAHAQCGVIAFSILRKRERVCVYVRAMLCWITIYREMSFYYV